MRGGMQSEGVGGARHEDFVGFKVCCTDLRAQLKPAPPWFADEWRGMNTSHLEGCNCPRFTCLED